MSGVVTTRERRGTGHRGMVAHMSISSNDIKTDWEAGDTLVVTMDGDSDGADGGDSDGADGDSDGSDGGDSDGADGGDSDGADA